MTAVLPTATQTRSSDPICNCLALRQASRRVTQLYDRALAPVGLRGTQLPILAELASGPRSMKILAAHLGMDRATLGHNIRPLQDQGLIAIAIGQDRRSRMLTLTDAGRTKLRQARGHWRAAQASFETAYGAEEAATLRAMLSRVASIDFVTDAP